MKKIVLIILILGVIFLSFFWFFKSEKKSNHYSKKEKVWQTTEIKKSREFSEIKVLGKIQSNKYAVISPRRNGIIKDLLVDIGDKITEGETIGFLFPEGVEGQNSATISQAQANLQKAKSELEKLKLVATESIDFANKNLDETQTKLDNLDDENNLSRSRIEQTYDELNIIFNQSYQNTLRVLFSENSIENSIKKLKGNFSSSNEENTIINLVKDLEFMEINSRENIYDNILYLEKILNKTEKLFKNSKTSSSYSKEDLEKNLKIIQNEQIKIIKAKEKLDNLKLEKNELESSLKKSQKSLELTESQQNLNITKAKNSLEIALANYNSSLIKAGHHKITSPFSGVITHRMKNVGEPINTNSILFMMDEVETSLASENAFEIIFSLPESWQKKIKIGKEIVFKNLYNPIKKTAKIIRKSSQINETTRDLILSATTNQSENLIHGQNVFVYIDDENSKIFSVPNETLKKRENLFFIWILEEEPKQIEVSVLAEDGEFVQIYSDEISENDKIIKNPSVSLFNKKEK